MSEDGSFDAEDAALLPGAAAARTAPLRRCPNCETATSEAWCGACGQRMRQRPMSLVALLWELLVDILDSDARIWRTLRALVQRPGELTLAWAEGRRQRYLPPFRLYLVLNVLLFLVLSAQIDGGTMLTADDRTTARAELQDELDALEGMDDPQAERRRAGLRTALATLGAEADPPDAAAAPGPQEAADEARRIDTALEVLETGLRSGAEPLAPLPRERREALADQLAALRAASPTRETETMKPARGDGTRPARDTDGVRISTEELSLGGAEDWLVDLGYPRERIDAVKRRVLEDPGRAAEDLYERMPLVMFMLLPLLATLLRGLYLLSGRPFVLHLVGLVHLHAFVFLLMLFIEGFTGFGLLLTSAGLESAAALEWIVQAVAAVGLPIYVVRWFMVLHGHGIPMALVMTALVTLLHFVGAVLGLVTLVLGSFVGAVVFGA